MIAIACVVVKDDKWLIGKDGDLLVNIPDDKKFFKETTMGKTVIMGRKTFESLPNKKPLSGRRNIILTRNTDYKVDNVNVVHDVRSLLKMVDDLDPESVFCIGGESVYKLLLPFCHDLLITKVYSKNDIDADRYFPNLDKSYKWECVTADDERVFSTHTYNDLIYYLESYINKSYY